MCVCVCVCVCACACVSVLHVEPEVLLSPQQRRLRGSNKPVHSHNRAAGALLCHQEGGCGCGNFPGKNVTEWLWVVSLWNLEFLKGWKGGGGFAF